MNEAAIEFKDFTFQYREQAEPTLYNINLRIGKGEKVMIAGPSGSGKSTIGHCINGLIPHYYKGKISGKLFVSGQDTANMDIFALSKHVGTVLQDADGQFVGLTVGEDIAFALENDMMAQSEMKEKVEEVARTVAIDTHLKAHPQELSGGQKQRVSLAGVMVDDVSIFLFDEPLANLDPATGKNAIELIDEIRGKTGATIIVIEHRLEDVLWRKMDRIIVMDEGRIIRDDTPDNILASGILRTTGIREPLYVTALSYAGVQITPEMHPESLNSMDVTPFRETIHDWERTVIPEPEPELGDEILSFSHVDFSYTDESPMILKDISFSIRRGEMTAIVGKNGSGKSTLCKLVCGFIKPNSGKILLNGEDAADRSIYERAQTVGYVMQNPNQMICKAMIREEVGFGLELRKVPKEEIDRRVDKVLQTCGLYPFRNWPVSALSYGQKKRVTIASILVLEPDLLILDEPTAGQDFRHYTEIMTFLQDLQQQGVTILMVTHDMHLMLEYARRSIVLADGHLICDDSAERVLSDRDVIERANLKETSLFTLAQKAGLEDPLRFIRNFITHEKELRS
ncbi:MAG: ABC transporter ATP-binding protein [Flexilinea sp.]|nr:ABC transporter ATP-binding protein [Flexilinea sp.]